MDRRLPSPEHVHWQAGTPQGIRLPRSTTVFPDVLHPLRRRCFVTARCSCHCSYADRARCSRRGHCTSRVLLHARSRPSPRGRQGGELRLPAVHRAGKAVLRVPLQSEVQVTVCGSDTVTSTRFAARRPRSVSLATFSRIPCAQDWSRASRTIRSRDRACIRSTQILEAVQLAADWAVTTKVRLKPDTTSSVRLKADTTSTRASPGTRATA